MPPPTTAATQPEADRGAQTQPQRLWKFRLVLAAAASDGNTDNANASGIFTATRETQRIRTVLDASYFFAESNDDTSENRFSTGFRHDWLNPGSRWFFFVDGRYHFDQFQSWDHRVQGHGGVGYPLILPPRLRLDLLAGLGALKEWGSDNDSVRPEGLLGIDGEYAFADRHALKFSSTLYPDLSNLSTFRWANSAAWSWTIDARSDLALTAGLQHEYQSEVDAGRERNDLRVYAGLQLDF